MRYLQPSLKDRGGPRDGLCLGFARHLTRIFG